MNAATLLAATLCVLALALPAAAQQTGRGDDPSAVPADQPTPTSQEGTDEGPINRLKRLVSGEEERASKPKEPEGFYPRIGGLTTGSGLALGAGYRKKVLSDAFYVDVSGVASTKRYLGLDGRLRLPSPTKRLELWSSVALRRFPQEDFFGVGSDSDIDNRTNYTLNSIDVGGQAIFHVTRLLQVGSDIGYFMPTVRAGKDQAFPTVASLFTDAGAPGLDAQPDYLHYGVFTAMDYRDGRGNPKNGGFYRATLARWNDRQFDAYDFNRFDAEANQYVPLTSNKRHVLVGRVGVSFVNNDTAHRVPFYVYPYVGGANTVRGFQEFRFRDENAMYFTGEYRLGIIDQVQAVAFIDRGKVARDWKDLNLRDLKRGWGVGVRAGTKTRTYVRLDVGTGGGEGRQIFFKFFPSF